MLEIPTIIGVEDVYIFNLILCALVGYVIGFEREARGKSAGISTQALVIGGAMTFSLLSNILTIDTSARIAAQIVTGVGFLGAGIILRSEGDKIKNLTTAASIWFSASIGMAIGFNYHLIAVLAAIYAVVVMRIPHPQQIIKEKKSRKR
jgi:putative Mg2+ transporter-C (MgtC) family protein